MIITEIFPFPVPSCRNNPVRILLFKTFCLFSSVNNDSWVISTLAWVQHILPFLGIRTNFRVQKKLLRLLGQFEDVNLSFWRRTFHELEVANAILIIKIQLANASLCCESVILGLNTVTVEIEVPTLTTNRLVLSEEASV